jgi:hypothetical protein
MRSVTHSSVNIRPQDLLEARRTLLNGQDRAKNVQFRDVLR